eukprot:2697328-Pyramimonas_sp.AAC.2
MFLGPRYLQERPAIGEAIWPTRSLVAGSARGVALAKVFLHPVLELAHRGNPSAGLWTFVDDTVVRCEGSVNTVSEQLVEVSTDICMGLVRQRMAISEKTTVIGSDLEQAKKATQRLLRRGIPAKATGVATDLGLDTAGGRKRVTTKGKHRQDKARERFARIVKRRRIVALKKEFKGLYNAGALPQAIYGQ